MEKIQKWAAGIALSLVVVILGSTILAIWLQSAAVDNFLELTALTLSWPLAAGGLIFGGGQAIIRAWHDKEEPGGR